MDWDEYCMNMVYTVALKSKDPQTHIGAVIVGPGHEIRSTGFNGLSRGLKETEERVTRPEKYYWYEHGERNAIYNASRNGVSLCGCALYTNGIPCADCARGIIQSGIVAVVVDKAWDIDNSPKWAESAQRSLEMFKEAGVTVRYWSGDIVVPKFRCGAVIK